MSPSPGLLNIITAALVLLSSGCGKVANTEIDFGAINNSVYTNNYFGMAASIPTNWVVQDQEAQRRLMKLGRKLETGDDKNLNAILKASELQSVNLFAAFEYPQGAPVTFNPSIISVAEKVRALPGIVKGKDYLFHARQLLESGQIKVSFPKDTYPQTLGGINFDVMETEMFMRGKVVRQKYYATIMKGYALCFIVSFSTGEDEAALQKILDTLTFK